MVMTRAFRVKVDYIAGRKGQSYLHIFWGESDGRATSSWLSDADADKDDQSGDKGVAGSTCANDVLVMVHLRIF